MEVAAIIPVRMGSTRYPGKPLVDIKGMTMVEHVYRRTLMSDLVDSTYIATPDDEIKTEVESFGGEVVMTGDHHERATGRCAEAAESLSEDVIAIVQGDEPLVFPHMIDSSIRPFHEDDSVICTNPMRRIESEEAFHDMNNCKVVVDREMNAMYFSREPVPNLYKSEFGVFPVYYKVGIRTFTRDSLFTFHDLEQTPLEKVESIDLLRFLENGYDIRMVKTEGELHSVDTPEDHELVNELMEDDELLPEYRP
jgi:3-deoxy-manno-octulosonate cytidylyltransferase (CMP-KDO synthetase)